MTDEFECDPDEKLREVAQEWLLLNGYVQLPLMSEEVEQVSDLAALLQRVRDETRAERDHSIGVGNWVHRDDGYWVIRTGVPRG